MRRNGLWIILICAFLMAGCAAVPTMEQPAEVKHSYGMTYEDAWKAALDVAASCNGTIINEDKESGLLVYSYNASSGTGGKTDMPGKIYMQVYLKSAGSGKIVIYAMPRGRYGRLLGATQKNFYEKFDSMVSKGGAAQ